MSEQTHTYPAWWIYTGKHPPHNGIERLHDTSPPWRTFDGDIPDRLREPPAEPTLKRRLSQSESDTIFEVDAEEAERVNVALYLRRPLLITGKPGVGKSSLAYSVAYELNLGAVLRWSITSRTTLKDGLYSYDAIGRLQDREQGGANRIGDYITLGPLGTALLPTDKPRVLLIDEIDKSDIDLPNDLLNVFEEGEYDIPELTRIRSADNNITTHVFPWDSQGPHDMVPVVNGRIRCRSFPFIVMTSNGERAFPPAFLRRCLQLRMQEPDGAKLERIVKLRLGEAAFTAAQPLIARFLALRDREKPSGDLATDQLLNAMYLVMSNPEIDMLTQDPQTQENRLQQALFMALNDMGDP